MPSTLGSRLRALRDELGLTQDEVSARSVDEEGRILRRIEVGNVEGGRNLASTKRVRASLARAFRTTEDELFAYLEGRVELGEFLANLERKSRGAERSSEQRTAPERAVEIVLADGYGTAVEVRRAAARLREELPAEQQARLGVLEWANLIEGTLRSMRRSGDPAAASGVVPRAAHDERALARIRRRSA